mmetsp:Transcript_32990/g.44691  ORF Transcript_32990/g.44691 Transcript_32990/m.44691 type:complete len:304 (+) Transcript_32990:49-960(+)
MQKGYSRLSLEIISVIFGAMMHHARALIRTSTSHPHPRCFRRHLAARADAQPTDGSPFLERLGHPKFVAAPMVGQSDLAFRLLVRRHGADLAFTQMLHAKNFATVPRYREDNFDGFLRDDQSTYAMEDRPLIAQFCGNDPGTVVEAASYIQDHVDAIDLNLGCPQKIAKKGRYGAFLLSEPVLVRSIVERMATSLDVPITVKIRMLPTKEETVQFACMLQDAGAAMVTVHGRTVKQNKNLSERADWSVVRAVREALTIPVVANGGIETTSDALRCLVETGADMVRICFVYVCDDHCQGTHRSI